jgi:hypothetical protein
MSAWMRASSPKFLKFVCSEGVWMIERGLRTRLKRDFGLGLVFASRWAREWVTFRGGDGVLAKIWGRPALASL